MEEVMERECSALGGLFQTLIGDMKSSSPVWDDFISKAGKLQSQLRATVVTVASFLDAFQKVADLATNSRGGTREIGGALTRMCMRQRSIETKLRHFSMVFLDCLILPLQDQMEDWKRNTHTLDKDHAKEYKKARQEIKKKSSDTARLQKKAKKADVFGRGDIQPQLNSAMQDVSDKYFLLEELEKQALRRALVEERSRFCSFASMLRPVVEEEMVMLGETGSLRSLNDDITTLTMDPHKLPPSSEQVIVDLKGSEVTWLYQSPPSSPSTTVSRKSSMCSSLSSDSHSPSSHFRFRGSSSSSSSSALPPPARLSSVSSHDSGFISHDASYQSMTSSPMPPDGPQDWCRPAPYDLRRTKTTDPSSQLACDVTMPVEESARARVSSSVTRSKEEREVHEELSRALARGLHLDLQGPSGGSLQGSSGYSSQTPTPAQTPSRSDNPLHTPGSDWDYFSMATDKEAEQERASSGGQSARRGFHPKRPAPSSSSAPLGVATIRRAPSSKPSLRRPPGAPGPVRTPMIPVKTPTVPDWPLGGPWTTSPPPPPPQQHQGPHGPRGPERRPLPGLLEETEQGEGGEGGRTSTDDRSARTH